MSTLEVDKIKPQSGTNTQLGESGDTITIPAGATITNNGTANGFGSADTEKVKVSSNDTTAGFLNGKLVAGTNISLTEGNDGGNETLTAALSGTISTAQIGANQVTGAKLNTDVISAQTELAAEPADTDELLISDAGVLKRVDYSHIKASPGLSFINSFTPSGSASTISLTGIFTSSFRNYRIVCDGLSIATNNSDMVYRFLTGTNTDHSSGYYWAIGTSNRNGTSVNENSDNDSSGRFLSNTSNDDGTIAGEFVVYGPNQSAKTTITHAFIDRYEGSATAHPQYGGCWVNAGDQFTGIRLFGSYNWDALGKITVYGMADS